ncbi:EamA family transporter [Salinibacterium sp. SYSU T00001]|uniref:EamA family transporter n=1 Tax=Homoserinimonas sedimenticola TaxID=2986805 RepID=UPI002235D51E|nr:EamA family transporter [Salinibacterium sedimenticola]MCW4386478.1 EamA family transporter [Salinibacterium sedimenticola]
MSILGRPRAAPVRARAAGAAIALGGAFSNQLGAATGSLAFAAMGPLGVVAVRQFVGTAILLPTVRPRIRHLTRREWWPVLALAAIFGTMNLSLYAAVERIGLGLAVTLEFLGPLAVAVVASRSRWGVVCGGLAALGVVAIMRPEASTDYIGIGLALIAACSWGAYILVNRTVGERIPGVEGTALATSVSALLFTPIGIAVLIAREPEPIWLLCAAAAGLFATVVPYAADMVALRRIPPALFGLLMSMHPVFAASIGAVMLGEALGLLSWFGIVLIVTANILMLAVQARAGRRLPRATEQPPAA